MSQYKLGELHKVDLREVWPSESRDFTPWLAQEENLKKLGDTLGIELELISIEKEVGSFSADLLCKDSSSDEWVIIENQLERTDHSHLGQILTYAAGLKATTIIWIARQFTDEHRAAIDWLNEITDENYHFFGIEIELWQIEDSPVAPKFNIVSKPNDWSKETISRAKTKEQEELSESKKLQLRFWTTFRQYVRDHSEIIKPTKPLPQHWMNMGIGRQGFTLRAIASMYDWETQSFDRQEIRSELVIHGENAKEQFQKLSSQSREIEESFGTHLQWYCPDNGKTCRIYVRKVVDLYDENDWPNQHAWLLENLEKMKAVFAKRIKQL